MQIRRFYQPGYEPGDATIALDESESQHALRVLRLRPGDQLQVLNGRGAIAQCELLPDPASARRPRNAVARVLAVQCLPRPERPVTLCAAIPRGKNFDLVLKAATELGVAAIQPMVCRHGVSRPEAGADSPGEAAITAAVKQSMNPWRPQLMPPCAFNDAVAAYGGLPGILGASPAAEATAAMRVDAQFAGAVQCLWIGPEGGFAPEEERLLLDCGCRPVTLGNCILRVETAVPAMLGFLYARRGAAC